ncbi:MAG: helix-hairpin-helix domain-containing protein, partial [Candidatus Kariarchaeaceae archaeon]
VKQGTEDYWIDLFESETKFDHNKNGLVLPFLLDLTDVDPIEDGIEHIWARHPDYPDIDIDFLPTIRSHLKEWAAERYGEENICSVGNWITYKPKSAIQDVCRAHGADLRKAIDVTSNLPDDFDQLDLSDLLEYRKNKDPEAEKFEKFYEYYSDHEEIVKIAFKMVGMIKAQGTHAGGLIISNHKLHDLIPLSLSKADGGTWASQWTEGRSTQMSKFGLIKFDILGLKTMFYVYKATEFIKKNRDVDIDWDDMDPSEDRLGWVSKGDKKVRIKTNDKKSMAMMNSLKTESIFQHETPIQKRIIEQGKCRDFWDMVAYTSLGRPGPIEQVPSYVENRNDIHKTWRETMNRDIADLLDDTHGIITFQEQLTEIWMNLGGFTMPQAEESRKIISKKWQDKLPKVKERWIKGAGKKLGEHEAVRWWDLMETFGRYAFNKSHAIAYSIISFRCLFLKTHFAPEWWAAVMSLCHPDKLTKYMGIAKSDGVKFSILDANNLRVDYDVIGDRIQMGLTSIKGIGEKAAVKFCWDRTYKSIQDFINRCGKDKKVMERLIKLGAFEEFKTNRQGLWTWYLYKYATGKDITALRADINSHFEWSEKDVAKERDRQADEYRKQYPNRKKIPNKILKWKPKIGPRHDVPSMDQIIDLYPNYTLREKLAFEKEFLGYYWTNPMDLFIHSGATVAKAKRTGVLEGVIENIEKRKTKKGTEYIILDINDGIEKTKLSVWPNVLDGSDENLIQVGAGVKVHVSWKENYNNFNIEYGSMVLPLKLKEHENGDD